MADEAWMDGLPPAEREALRAPCQRCRVLAGSPCRTYKGQRKATCSDRGRRPPSADRPLVQRSLFPPDGGNAYGKR